MKRAPLPTSILIWHLVALAVASFLLVVWIYQIAQVTQPTYSNPDYGVTRTYQP